MSERVERIEYDDIWFDPDESSAASWPEEWIVTVVGYVVRETKQVISLAHEVQPDGGFRAVTHIPTSAIRDRKVLVEGGKLNGKAQAPVAVEGAHR